MTAPAPGGKSAQVIPVRHSENVFGRREWRLLYGSGRVGEFPQDEAVVS